MTKLMITDIETRSWDLTCQQPQHYRNEWSNFYTIILFPKIWRLFWIFSFKFWFFRCEKINSIKSKSESLKRCDRWCSFLSLTRLTIIRISVSNANFSSSLVVADDDDDDNGGGDIKNDDDADADDDDDDDDDNIHIDCHDFEGSVSGKANATTSTTTTRTSSFATMTSASPVSRLQRRRRRRCRQQWRRRLQQWQQQCRQRRWRRLLRKKLSMPTIIRRQRQRGPLFKLNVGFQIFQREMCERPFLGKKPWQGWKEKKLRSCLGRFGFSVVWMPPSVACIIKFTTSYLCRCTDQRRYL